MGTEATENENELKKKVTLLVSQQFGGDWDAAFRKYAAASGKGSLMDQRDIKKLLEAALIGNRFTRSRWADGIIERLDSNHDEQVSMMEFRAVFHAD